MRRPTVLIAAIVAAAVVATAALAATATPFGGATVNGGVLRLVSNTGDAAATNDVSGASFSGTGVTTFSSITTTTGTRVAARALDDGAADGPSASSPTASTATANSVRAA
jgi:hypothetical protein